MDSFRIRATLAGNFLPRVLQFVLAGCLAIAASAKAHADYVFTTIDCPGAVGTSGVSGINNVGAIVGGCTAFPSGAYMAARQTDGTFVFTGLPVAPGGLVVTPWGINDTGTISGQAVAPDSSYSMGFLLNGSTYAFYSDPSSTFTFGEGINAAGVVIGEAQNPPGGTASAHTGFIYDPNMVLSSTLFTDFTVLSAVNMQVRGINNANQVVGSYRIPTSGLSFQSFLRDPSTGVLSLFQIATGQDTRARGINNTGLISGFTLDPSTGTFEAFVGNSSGYQVMHSPFFDQTTTDTFGTQINDSGQIVGATAGIADNSTHGFIITPAYATAQGANVTVSPAPIGSVTVGLTFPEITSSGLTTVVRIDPALAGTLPSGYTLSGAGLAFEIATTATYTTPPPIIIAFEVPSVDLSTFAALRILHNEGGVLVDRTASDPAPDPTTRTIYASVSSLSPFVIAKAILHTQVQQPINPDGSSIFNASRGVVPVKFSLSAAGTPTCELPVATISLTRTAGSVLGSIDENIYLSASDTGSNYRVAGCQYLYNMSTSALGAGTYRVDVLVGGGKRRQRRLCVEIGS